jgi:hypothetical protein
VPGWENPNEALTFGATLRALEMAAIYELDFANVSFVTPGWLLAVGDAIRNFRSARPDAKRRAVNFRHLTYPAHVGFFKYFGLGHGHAPAEAHGSDTYVPIKEVHVAQLKEHASQKFLPLGEMVDEDSRQLARVLTQLNDGEVVDTLTYSIREIVRNVVEHSDSVSYTISAQYWPMKNCAELAVSDSGCGILRSLRENPKLEVTCEADALKLALLPGISSKAWRHERMSGVWANSGYGLFMTQRLCSLGGEFTLLSGDAGLRIVNAANSIVECHAPGTTVILKIDVGQVANLSKRLAEFRTEGSALARLVGGANRLGPSLASYVLNPANRPV